MKELITVWRNTRMIVFVGVSAALYVALLLPFKGIVIFPGLMELRPGAVVPLVCSLLFGPAGAWGAAFGNVIGDMLGGMLGLGSVFGFLGNLLLGYVPYRVWRALSAEAPTMRRPVHYAKMVVCVAMASACCGTIIGWGVHGLGLAPFRVLGNLIVTNNILWGVVLAPTLLLALYGRLDRMGLVYTAMMEERDLARPRWPRLAVLLLAGACVAALVAGNLLSGRVQGAAFLVQMSPLIALELVAVALL